MSRRLQSIRMLATGIVAIALPCEAGAQRAQTITRAELDAAGWTRLSELVFAVRGVARTTVDGITTAGDVAGMPAWSLAPDEAWVVLVDGQPVPIAFGGAQVLDLLPVSLAQLDSVTLHRAPTLARGRIAMHGVLHLHTQRRFERLRASVSHYSGNEAGDPGPFAFTSAATPNVDNSGPFHQGRIAYGTARWDADVAIRRWTDNLTDQRMRARYERAAAPDAPDLWVQQLAPTMRVGVNALGGRHDAYAGVARLRGTFFVPAPREDQSLSSRLEHAGVAGAFVAGSTTTTYRGALSRLDAGSSGGPLPATLAHERREVTGALESRRTVGSVSVSAGLAGAHRALRDAMAAGGALPRSEVEVDALGAVEAEGAWRPQAAATLGRGVGGARASVMLGMTRSLDERTTLDLRAAGGRRALGDDGRWLDLALFGVSPIAHARRTSMVATATWSRLTAGGATVEAGASARREAGLHVIVPDSVTSVDSIAPRVRGPSMLGTAELRGAVELPFGGVALGGATYRLSVPVAGDASARDAAATLPRHLLDASVTAAPALDIRLRLALHLASRTHWSRARLADDARVPSIARLDLAAEKWVFARRLRLHVLARNLLNDVERYHPLGADFRLRVFAGATASF